jgi:hypothetical protein
LIFNSIPPNAPTFFFWVRGFRTAVSNEPPLPIEWTRAAFLAWRLFASCRA